MLFWDCFKLLFVIINWQWPNLSQFTNTGLCKIQPSFRNFRVGALGVRNIFFCSVIRVVLVNHPWRAALFSADEFYSDICNSIVPLISRWSYHVSLHHSLFASLCLPVPIIPSYLYNLDESTDVVLKNNTPSQQNPPGAFHNIVSLYDNTVRSLVSNTTAMSTDLVPIVPTATEVPLNSSDCPRSNSKLLNENVKVGMLFASKATIQLITNPFIGPLTNR